MRWKWVLMSVVLLAIALVVTVYAVLASYDYNKLKPQIARMVQEATGRELTLGGEVDLTIGFSPSLVIKDVALANAPWGTRPQMIQVDKLALEVKLLPLLFREVALQYVGLVGVDVFLEIKPDGKGNWAFDADRGSGKGAAVLSSLGIDIDHLIIENLRLAYRQGESGATTHYTIDRLDVARQAAADRLVIDLRAGYNDYPVAVSGQTGVLRDVLDHKRFPLALAGTFSGAKVEITGAIDDVPDLQGIALKMHVSGTDLAELGLDKMIPLPKARAFEATGLLQGSKESLALKDINGKFSGSDLHLAFSGNVGDLIDYKGVDLRVKGSGQDLAAIGSVIGHNLPATDTFDFGGRLQGSTAILSLGEAQASANRGSLNLRLNGAVKDLLNVRGLNLQVKGSGKDLADMGPIIGVTLPVTDDFVVAGRLQGSAGALQLTDAKGHARQGGLNLTLRGEINDILTFSDVDLEVSGSGAELAEIGPLVGADLPELGPFDLSAKLTGSAKAISLSAFSARVDKSDFKGQAKVDFLKRPKITLRLESSVIDFTRLMKTMEKNEEKPVENMSQPHRLFSDASLPFEVFKKVDADILINARNIRAKDARLEFGHMTLKLEDGDFSIDRLEATYKKTKISGNLNIDPSAPPRVAVNFLVQRFDLGNFLKETGKSDTVKAVVDIAAHGKSRGSSVQSLVSHLDGTIGAVMGKGYLTKYLNMLSVNLSQKVLSFWDWARHNREKADQINCAVVQFDIKEGVATSQAFVFDSQLAVLTGEGEINLGSERIDFLLVPNAKDPALLSLSTNLRVSGPLLDPQVRPDKRSLLTQGAWALSSLAIGPLGLLAPFVHLGAHKAHPCDVPGIGHIEHGTPPKKNSLSP